MELVWNRKQQLAAQLVAEGDLPMHEIAATIGVSLGTLKAWKNRPEFKERVEELRDEIAEALMRGTLRVFESRLRNLLCPENRPHS